MDEIIPPATGLSECRGLLAVCESWSSTPDVLGCVLVRKGTSECHGNTGIGLVSTALTTETEKIDTSAKHINRPSVVILRNEL